eukprot:1071896-Alexandrium_andersonii.AAC.1
MAQATEAAAEAVGTLAERGRPRIPSLQAACGLARQRTHALYGYVLQTGYSPRVLRAAGKVDQALRGHVF